MSFTPETAPTFETMQESINDRIARRGKLVGCPHCAALPTDACTDKKGRPVSNHVARYRAWRRKRQALAASLAVADSYGWTVTPEPNTDYRMRNHTAEKTYDEGRVRVIKIEVLKAPGGGFKFWFAAREGRGGTSDALTANFDAVCGPWARTFEKVVV